MNIVNLELVITLIVIGVLVKKMAIMFAMKWLANLPPNEISYIFIYDRVEHNLAIIKM